MAKLGSVAVVVVNFNSGNWLAKCIKGLAGQSLHPDQIIIVDNDSTDDSISSLTRINLPLQILTMEHNLGFAAANNAAIQKYVSTEWVALLNPDAVPDKNWLRNLLGRAQYSDLAVVGSVMRKAGNPELLDGYGDAYHSSGLAWRIGHGLRETDPAIPIFSICAGAALVNVEVFRELKGFEESFFCYYEDVDFGFRLRLRGYKIGIESTAIVDHKGGGCNGRRSDTAVYYGHRNLVWTYVRNMPGYLFWLYLPEHIALNLFSIAVGIFRGQGMVILKSKWDAIRGIGCAFSQRRAIQRKTLASNASIRQALVRGVRSWSKSRKWMK